VGGIDKRQLNKDHIEEFPIIYPPLKHQYDFVTKLLLTQNQKKQLEVSAKESKNLFNKLMNLNFS
jgi:restriction endonuclease S subunit